MEDNNRVASKCSNCQFFSPDGCRFGYCRKLDVPAEGKQLPCVLYIAAFARADRVASVVRNRQDKLSNPPWIAA